MLRSNSNKPTFQILRSIFMGKEQPIPLGKNGQIEQLPVNPNPGGPSQSQEPPEVNRGDRRVLYRRKNFYIKKNFSRQNLY